MRVTFVLVPALFAFASPAFAADLTLTRVMLSSAGVGYFEYQAAVDGPGTLGSDVPGTLGLDVGLNQVDDVLKSLVVFDDAGGVGGIELPGRDGAHRAFAGVPFGPEALASPLAFLNSLHGVEVTVEGPRPMTGRLMRAEVVPDAPSTPPSAPQAPAPRRTRVSLMTDAGLRQFVLEDADAVQVADPVLRARITQALQAARHETAQDVRHITLRTTGPGTRTVRVGYVAAAPVWKASYRLVLPSPGAAKARLQGWATFENATDADWQNVALSVQYGNPVTFRQAIYKSYYVTRPEVPVDVMTRLLPDVDTRARIAMPPPPSPAPPSAPAPMMAAPRPAIPSLKAEASDEASPSLDRQDQPILAGGGSEAAAQEGREETLFTLKSPLSLAAGHSASVPILDTDVPAVRVALLTPGAAHPLAAVRVTNDTGASLPAGVLTLYGAAGDTPYAGDARLGGVPAHQSRLVSFAQDLRTTAEWKEDAVHSLAAVTAADGVLTAIERDRRIAHATVTAPENEARHVLIDVPKQDGLAVATGFAQPAEQTATAWRFALDLAPGETKTLTFALDRDEGRSIAMLDEPDDLVTVAGLEGLPDAARAALSRIAALRAAETARTAERDRLTTQQEALDADETRLRENLKAVQPTDALRTRLVRQLDADETRHAQLSTAVDTANAAIDKAHTALVDAIQMLKL